MTFSPLPQQTTSIDWSEFARELGDVPSSLAPARLRQRSRDCHWFSPILRDQLRDCQADILAFPRNEDDVQTVVRACVRHQAPLTVRGAGTGNYGQAVPLAGGVVLDMTGMASVLWVKDGTARAQAGIKLSALEDVTLRDGWELRLFPSTKRTATLGGFVAGGSGGVGGIQFGGLKEPGNISALRVVSMEDTPRVLELRGRDVQQVHHASGTNGIITEVEIPLAPARIWIETIAVFDSLLTATRFGYALAATDGIVKKVVTVFAPEVPGYFRALQRYLPEGHAATLAMVASESLNATTELVEDFGGRLAFIRHSPEEDPRVPPLYEYTFNHTTLHALKHDRGITYLGVRFLLPEQLDLLEETEKRYRGEVLYHLEIQRSEGRIFGSGLPLVRYTTAERLQQLMAEFDRLGVMRSNPHTFVTNDEREVPPEAHALKLRTDPLGLLNPGKIRATVPAT